MQNKCGLLALVTAVAGLSIPSPAHAARENWYFGFGMGAGSAQFSGSKKTEVSLLEDSGSVGVTLASQMFFYWPIADVNTLLGVSSGGTVRVLGSNDSEVNASAFGVGMLSFDALHSFGPEPGSGLLLKGSVGYGSVYRATGNVLLGVGNDPNFGPGIRAAGGYGWAVTGDARILFLVEYGRVFAGDGHGYFTLSVAPMF